MALKFPPPPQFSGPQWQQLNRWFLEIQSILSAAGTTTFADGSTAVTQPLGDNSNLLATDAFVIQNAGGVPAAAIPQPDATPGEVGVSIKYAREDHVHPTDITRAPIASPGFTGTPTAPTPAPGDNSNELATTDFVATSFAPLASPHLTGTPTAPTAAPGTNTTQVATTAFVEAAIGSGALTPITNSLVADVPLNNTAAYFDGPSIPQGSAGTWFVSGTVTVVDTASTANVNCKLWDGTTVIASCNVAVGGAGFNVSASLSGFITAPAGNLRISCKDTTSVNGKIVFNFTGNSKDSTITAIRIA